MDDLSSAIGRRVSSHRTLLESLLAWRLQSCTSAVTRTNTLNCNSRIRRGMRLALHITTPSTWNRVRGRCRSGRTSLNRLSEGRKFYLFEMAWLNSQPYNSRTAENPRNTSHGAGFNKDVIEKAQGHKRDSIRAVYVCAEHATERE